MKKVLFGLAIIFFAGSFTSLRAQYMTPYYLSNYSLAVQQQMQRSMMSQAIFNQSMANSMLQKRSAQRASSRGAQNAVPRQKTPTNTTPKTSLSQPSAATNHAVTLYKSAPGILVVERFGANAADEKTKFLQELAGRSWQQYQQAMWSSGLQPTDLASAVTYFLALNYGVYNGSAPSSQTQKQALYNQIKEMMTGNPDLARMRDEEKQVYAETVVVMATMPVFLKTFGERQNNNEMLHGSKEMARKNLETMLGGNFEQMTFTDEGLSSTD